MAEHPAESEPTGHETLEGYLSYLRQSNEETRALLRDLLIGVTNFFRDEESWRRLTDGDYLFLGSSESADSTASRAWL